MTIQFNTDNNVHISDELRAPLIELVSEELNRFRDKITRIEIHLSDEDSNKQGLNDKRCMIEVRLAGMKPIGVTNHARTHEKAVAGAINKLITTLDTIIGRLRNHYNR